MIQYLAPLSKLFISISTLCGFISLFFNIGMTGKDVRYGINEYFFVFNNSSRYGLIVACCFLILHFSNSSPKEMLAYKIMTVFDIFANNKRRCLHNIGCLYCIILYLEKKKETKFTTGNTLILSICIMIASTLQINTYLRDEESPRMVLLRYGFKTANKYLPFAPVLRHTALIWRADIIPFYISNTVLLKDTVLIKPMVPFLMTAISEWYLVNLVILVR